MTSESYLLNWCMRDRTTRESLTTTGTPIETTTAMCCSLWQEATLHLIEEAVPLRQQVACTTWQLDAWALLKWTLSLLTRRTLSSSL